MSHTLDACVLLPYVWTAATPVMRVYCTPRDGQCLTPEMPRLLISLIPGSLKSWRSCKFLLNLLGAKVTVITEAVPSALGLVIALWRADLCAYANRVSRACNF